MDLVSTRGPETNPLWILSITNEIILSSSRLISWVLHYNTRAFWRINANRHTLYYPSPVTDYPQMNNHLLPFIVSLSLEFRNVWFWLGVSYENTVRYRMRLQSSEGLTGEGGSSFKMASSCASQVVAGGRPQFLFMWASPQGCLNFLMMLWH